MREEEKGSLLIVGVDSFFFLVRGRIGAALKRGFGGIVLGGCILGWSLRKSTQEREKGDCSQDCPSTFLVTLGVLIHIQSFHLVVSKNSMYC